MEERKMKKGNKKNKKGFTLIELVVVIAILGILAAILIPVISGFIETANQATDNANARLIYQAAAMWFASTNSTGALVCQAADAANNIRDYVGLTAFPTAKSKKFAGTFSATVNADFSITVATGGHTYVPATGKLS
jgi:prepilin-type N-terminal cleavage/methylation domain-containing protein